MSDKLTKDTIGQALRLLDGFLREGNAAPVDLVVCGGSSLIALGLVVRTTRDVDVMALRKPDGELLCSNPLPESVEQAVRRVADVLGLDGHWLNAGPASQIKTGFPEGMAARLHPVQYGTHLTISYVDRYDLIHFKVCAATDNGPGRHADDLLALKPTPEEMLAAAQWALTQDVSEGFRTVLKDMLRRLGYERASGAI